MPQKFHSTTTILTERLQVWCTPNSHFPVLDTKSSSVSVQAVEYTIRPKTPGTDEPDQRADSADAVEDTPGDKNEERTPETPTAERGASFGSGHTDTLPDADTPSTFSNSGSVVVRSDLPNESPSAGFQNPSSSNLWIDVTSNGPSRSAVIPRKRNSETASLPESVSDSERTYGGHKHRSRLSVDTQTISSLSSRASHSKRPSLIPRPVSASIHAKAEPAKIPLPSSPAPVLGTEYKFSDERFAATPDIQSDGREVQFSELSSPVTPRRSLSPSVSGGRVGLNLERLSKLSTVVTRDSPCDLSAFSSEKGSSCSGMVDENLPFDGAARVQQSSSSFRRRPEATPRLVLINGAFSIRCPPDTEPAVYDVRISFLVNLQKGRPRDWWEIVVPGLPRLSSNDHGYVYFRMPPDQGIEVRTTHFKRHTLMDSCLMAQFLIPSKIVIPFRLCDAQFYGFLRDFKVTQAIRADVESEGDGEICLVKYNAVCSVDLIQRAFWSRQCGFFIYIYGGPQGEFSCHLQQSQQLPAIQLDTEPETRIGVSEVQVICAPSNLPLFAVSWEVRLPRRNACTWVPRIQASLHSGNTEVSLQAEFEEAQASKAYEIVRAQASGSPIEREHRNIPHKQAAWWKTLLRFCWVLIRIMLLLHVLYRFTELYRCCEKANSLRDASPPAGKIDDVGDIVADQVAEFLAPQTDDSESMENGEPAMPLPTPLPPLPLRDRIDYLLGWRGPLQG